MHLIKTTLFSIDKRKMYYIYSTCLYMINVVRIVLILFLSILAIPQAPSLLFTTNVTTSAIALSWQAGFDGFLPQTFSIYYRVNNQDSYIIGGNTTATKFTLKNLQHRTTYEIYVVARNSLGISQASNLILVQTLTSKSKSLLIFKFISTILGLNHSLYFTTVFNLYCSHAN